MKVDELRDVRTIVVHDRCADGLASAIILKDVLPAADLKFIQFESPEHQALESRPGVLFCDCTPWVERVPAYVEQVTNAFDLLLSSWVKREAPARAMSTRGRSQAQAWVDMGVLVLDHHSGVADLVAALGDRVVYADAKARPGVSGATLAYEEVWSPLVEAAPSTFYRSAAMRAAVKRFAERIGIRDTWQRGDASWCEACACSAALMFYPRASSLGAGLRGVLDRTDSTFGEVIIKQQVSADTRTITEAYYFKVPLPHAVLDVLHAQGVRQQPNLRVVCFEGDSRSTSDVAEALGEERVDLVVGWHYFMRGGEVCLKLSFRTSGTFQCLPLAQSLAGNGHGAAAGCILLADALTDTPYRTLQEIVSKFCTP